MTDITLPREVVEKALEALDFYHSGEDYSPTPASEAITALRTRLAVPKQEPVAWMVYTIDGKSVCVTDNPSDFTNQYRALPLYTAFAAEQPKVALTTKEITMPITDDNGKPLHPQYRVIEQIGNWYLLYDQHQSGEAVRHEFRIQKLRHDIALYPGISLAKAQKRFRELVEADNE